ncbi:hypothetical protein ACWD5R_01105 [Streptomyces sp. NPDC002514]|uniref:hypothetical protein n=1 Tax=unclassified Streptomyces TaxID=2593676 RepID=UPI0036931A0B
MPHLIARVSELVLRLGYEPDDLVIMPRGELDRREMAAYSAGWADVVDEQLPAVRRAYEQRITAAYVQGQEDGRSGRRPRLSRGPESERLSDGGGEVIPLPYVQLLRPPPEVTRVERRGERERSVADGAPLPAPALGVGSASEDALVDGDAVAAVDVGPGSDFLLSAREVREKRAVPAAGRRTVVRRNGRPSVPPLTRPQDAAGSVGNVGNVGNVANGRDKGRRAEPPDRPEQEPTGPAGRRSEERTRLSDKARALADELEGRAPDRRRDE